LIKSHIYSLSNSASVQGYFNNVNLLNIQYAIDKLVFDLLLLS